jgi:hypothetical protein
MWKNGIFSKEFLFSVKLYQRLNKTEIISVGGSYLHGKHYVLNKFYYSILIDIDI